MLTERHPSVRLTRTHLWRLGLANACLTLAAPVLLFVGEDPRSVTESLKAIIDWRLPAIGTFLVPLCVAVGWRSTWYARRLVHPGLSWLRPPFEGAAVGFVLPVSAFWLGPLSVVLAAAGGFESAASWKMAEWLAFAAVTALYGAFCAFFGALWGLVIGAVTVMVVRRVEARQLVRQPS